MARYFDVVGGGARIAGEGGLVVNGSGFMIYVYMILMSGAIMSMIILTCGKRNFDRDNKNQKKRSDVPNVDCGDCSFCFGGGGGGGHGPGHG
ncbi:hypothetical protein CsSME_00026777 [Camellia sinensis var. sinensis]